ncbi:MAG: ThiF family adenylyltransferase [Candidatus Peribacteraceae bacterium]|nr:ThiF family adenylyltransferase [Candidatus Peribacteraceae bacterium]
MELDISNGRRVRDFLINQFGRETDDNGNTRREIEMRFPDTVMVIGLGGIGGHLAEYIGAMKTVKTLVVVDDDDIEVSNLNRTAYSYFHVGMSKAEAITAQIMGRNMGIEVKPLITRFDADLVTTILEKGKGFEFRELFGRPKNGVLVFDCRDDFYDDYSEFERLFIGGNTSFKIMRAAYDGLSMTLDANPEKHHVWGGNRGYETVPSHALPSRLVASLIISMATAYYNDPEGLNEKQFNNPITFHLFDVVSLMFDGLKHREAVGKQTIPVNVEADDDGDDELSNEDTLHAEVSSVEGTFPGDVVEPIGIPIGIITGHGIGQ